MATLRFQQAYDSILNYAPPKVREVLAREIPNIESAIDREVDKFGIELGQYLQSEIKKLREESQSSHTLLRSKIQESLTALAKSSADASQSASAAINELNAAMDEYEKKWAGYGEKLASTALIAVRAAGVPLRG